VNILYVDLDREWRGGQSQALLTLRGLIAAGHRVELLAARKSPLAERSAAEGIAVIGVPRVSLRISAAAKIAALLRSGRFDLLHLNEPHALTAAWLAGAHRRVPLLLSRRIGFPLGKSWVSGARYRAVTRFLPNSVAVAQSLLLGSPPGSGQTSVGADTWELTVEVAYSPGLLSYPLAGAPDLVWPWTDTPNLKDILQAQQPATIWADPATPVSQFPATLTLGQNLALRSATTGSPASLSSSLNISQGASPP